MDGSIAMTALSARGLRRRFGDVVALDGLDLDVAAGEVVALIGPNGAGKSTCFNILNGQIRPTSGTVRLFGTNVTGAGPLRIGRLGVGRTFQIAETFGSMSVVENVQIGLIAAHRWTGNLWTPVARLFFDEAHALLERVGIAQQADRPCNVLSYGDVKRVELAIALTNRPKLLLMDEPTAGMAPIERLELMTLVASLVTEQGISVLFTEHDMDVVFRHADRLVVLHRGRCVAAGRPDMVRADRRVQAIYLGINGSASPPPMAPPR